MKFNALYFKPDISVLSRLSEMLERAEKAATDIPAYPKVITLFPVVLRTVVFGSGARTAAEE